MILDPFMGGGMTVVESLRLGCRVIGIAVRRDGRTRVLLANLSPEPQQVTVQNLGGSVRVRRIDETNAQEAMTAPEAFRAEAGEVLQTTEGRLEIRLLPYAVVRVDSV